ncbi:hypothetical protein [Oleiharenicola lentus]|uniref:hypothetical protein n=1 Tax=Oleiharenicola lentus TaxID=2508720 RepID=UPI003F6750CB
MSQTMRAIFKPEAGPGLHMTLTPIPRPGVNDVLVTRAGPTGCMAIAVVKHAGARKIVITEIKTVA